MTMLEKTLNAVSTKTFTNCFKKAGIFKREVGKVLNDEDDSFAGLDEIEEDTVQTLEANLAVLKEKFGDQIDADITSDDYVDFDIEVITSHEKLTNQEILAEINDDVNEESDGEEEDPNDFEPINKPGIEHAREALQFLEDFSLSLKFGESMLKSLKELNHSLDREKLSHKKKCNCKSVTSFFFQSNRFEFIEECIFIFLTHPFSTRAPNSIFKYAQILATLKMTKFSCWMDDLNLDL